MKSVYAVAVLIIVIGLIFVFSACGGGSGGGGTVAGIFSLFVSSNPQNAGSVCINQGSFKNEVSETVIKGMTLQIKAESVEDYAFTGWYEHGIRFSEENPATITVNENRLIEARFNTIINNCPVIEKVSGISGDTNNDMAVFKWIGSDEDGRIDYYEYKQDDHDSWHQTSQMEWIWRGYAPGQHTFHVRAVDDKGANSNTLIWYFNYEQSSERASVILESTPSKGGDVKLNESVWGKSFNEEMILGTEIVLDSKPNEGYEFIGWHKDSELVNIQKNFSFALAEETVLEAVFSDGEIFHATIYGDQEGAEFLQGFLYDHYNYPSRVLHAFSHFKDQRGKGIYIHLKGDRLDDETCMTISGKTVEEIDAIANDEGCYYVRSSLLGRPVLLLALKNTGQLETLYNDNLELKKHMDEIIFFEYKQKVDFEEIVWESSGHTPKLFPGLFKNPDYSNTALLLGEDGICERTDQVMAVAGLINDNQDLSTLKEIYNLLVAINNEQQPEKIFEVSASQILSTPVLGGCTTYATAYSALARAKGIPTVVVDSADLDWINDGCSLNYVSGHFWVEVKINDVWYLINSTNGRLYRDYDRSNWFLPEDPYKYIVFAKSLSVIDTGATEDSHNPLQKVAFIFKDIDYEDPDYPMEELFDEEIMQRLKQEYQALGLQADNDFTIDYSGETFTVEATSAAVDFQNIQ